MKVRPFQPEDGPSVGRLFTESVNRVSVADYSRRQIEAWASRLPDVERWRTEVEGRFALVAEHDPEIVGFATAEPDGHLEHLYVDHHFQRRGVASALLQRVEEELCSRGLKRIFTEASIPGRPFFEHAGFRLLTAQHVSVKGVLLLNYRMEKLLV